MEGGHNDFAAQHFTPWEAAAFRLPVAQQEALGWWDTCTPWSSPPGPSLSHYCLQPPGLLGHGAGKDAGFSPGITDIH